MKQYFLLLGLIGMFSGGSANLAHAEFDYGHTCPTVDAAIIRLEQERKDAALESLKSGKVSSLNTHIPVPGSFQGYWSLPNCDTPDVTTIYTKYFSYSLIFGAEACLQKVRDVQVGIDFTQITVPSDNIINKPLSDKSFEAGFTEDDLPADLKKNWDENTPEDSQSFKFNYCGAPDPKHYKLHAPGIKLIRYMDHALEICDQRNDLSFKDNEDCHHLLYVMADGNIDFELTAEEIEKALLMLNYLSFINHNGAAIDNLVISMDKAKAKAQKSAELAIKLLDSDGNSTLTRVEIVDNYKKLPKNSPDWHFYKKKFASIANIFPSFAAESEKTE